MAQGFLAVVSGKIKQVFAIVTSTGASDSGKIPALDSTGKLDSSFLPTGIGQNTVVGTASEALSAGDFVNLYNNSGAMGVRKADNSNNREAWGYVNASVASGGSATVYRLNTVNASRTGLTAGTEYWLGVAGGVISTPLDPVADTGKTSQYLGIAKSTTELATTEYQAIQL